MNGSSEKQTNSTATSGILFKTQKNVRELQIYINVMSIWLQSGGGRQVGGVVIEQIVAVPLSRNVDGSFSAPTIS